MERIGNEAGVVDWDMLRDELREAVFRVEVLLKARPGDYELPQRLIGILGNLHSLGALTGTTFVRPLEIHKA